MAGVCAFELAHAATDKTRVQLTNAHSSFQASTSGPPLSAKGSSVFRVPSFRRRGDMGPGAQLTPPRGHAGGEPLGNTSFIRASRADASIVPCAPRAPLMVT